MSAGDELRAAEQSRAGAAAPVGAGGVPAVAGGALVGALTLGQRLRAERERQGMSAAKAADGIHLDAWAIDALESGDYARLGPAVYVKGHLKRYADVLRLPSADIVAAFDPRASEAPPTEQPGNSLRAPAAESRERDLPWLQIAAAVVVLLIVAGVVWWKPWRARTPAVAMTEQAASATRAIGADTDASAAHAPTPGLVTPAAPQSAAPTAAPTAVPTPGPGPARATALAAARPAAADSDSSAGLGRARLRLTFTNDSWLDVHDAAGRRVFAGNCPAHSMRTLTGTAPLRIHLGAAAGVQMDVNNRPVSIPAQFIVRNAADFAAGADGVLRALPPGSSPAAQSPAAQSPAAQSPAAHPRG